MVKSEYSDKLHFMFDGMVEVSYLQASSDMFHVGRGYLSLCLYWIVWKFFFSKCIALKSYCIVYIWMSAKRKW